MWPIQVLRCLKKWGFWMTVDWVNSISVFLRRLINQDDTVSVKILHLHYMSIASQQGNSTNHSKSGTPSTRCSISSQNFHKCWGRRTKQSAHWLMIHQEVKHCFNSHSIGQCEPTFKDRSKVKSYHVWFKFKGENLEFTMLMILKENGMIPKEEARAANGKVSIQSLSVTFLRLSGVNW